MADTIARRYAALDASQHTVRRAGRVIGALLPLGFVDALLLPAYLLTGAGAGGGVGIVMAAHSVLTAVAFAIWLRRGARGGFAAAMLGVLGPLGLLLGLSLARLSPAGARRADDDVFDPVSPRLARRGARLAVARLLDGRIHLATPETLGSLVTIMRHGNVAARRRALETVVRSFEPALSPLIALALTDRDQTIRALAAAASARVVDNLALARERLSARIAEGPDPEAVSTLASLLADHARRDVLLSDSQRIHLREDAVATITAQAADLDETVVEDSRRSMMLETFWANGDYDAIDALALAIDAPPPCEQAQEKTRAKTDDTLKLATWWRTGTMA